MGGGGTLNQAGMLTRAGALNWGNTVCLGKYLSKSFETLDENYKTLRKRSLKEFFVMAMISVQR